MTCERAKELMIDALVEPLDAARLEELKEHLDACDSCATEAASYEHLWSCLETVAIPEPTSDGAERLERAVEEEFGVTIESSAVKSTEDSGFAWRLAAAVLLIATGSLLTFGIQQYFGVESEDAAVDNRSRYVIIMTETREPAEQFAEAQAAFDAWIDDLIEQGIMETGIGLADQPPVGTPPSGALMDLTVRGFIVIRAENAQEAIRISLTSPVIDYGGLVEVRELAGNNPDE